MEIKNWLKSKSIQGGDSEVRLFDGYAYKKWHLPLEQVRLYQQVTNMCVPYTFDFKRFNISVLPIKDVFMKGNSVMSKSEQLIGQTVNTLSQPDKQQLGTFFQNELGLQLIEITGANGINVITWNAILLDDNRSVVISDIASDVSSISL